MRIISFAWTTPALVAGHKTCTRRDWNDEYAAKFQAGDLLAGWDKSPRFKGHQVAVIRLTVKPYKEPTKMAPESDWEAEGFAYLSSIGAKVNGMTPEELWQIWHSQDSSLWVVRFELIEICQPSKFEHRAGEVAVLQCPLCFAAYIGENKQ